MSRCDAPGVDEELISRGEIVGLLFNLGDTVDLLAQILAELRGADGEEEVDEG